MDPFSNPFSSASNDDPTVAPKHVASSDVIPGGRRPPVMSQSLAPRAANVASSARAPSNVAFRDVSRETTGSIEPAPVRSASGGWTTAGGTPIVVADGETAEIIAQRYGVPSRTLIQVNGLNSAAEVRPGSRITVPVYSATASAAPRASHPAEAVAQAEERKPAAAPAHARLLPPKPVTAVATSATPASKAAPATRLASARTATKQTVAANVLTLPAAKAPAVGAKGVGSSPKIVAAKTVAVAEAAPAPVAPAAKAGMKVASAAATAASPTASKAVPAVQVGKAPAADTPAAAPSVAAADGTPEFRWPARGRIIQSFKSGSGGNDGINIAVPEGTSVRAAEGGVVAYAGSELKGYGNLVLIKHPNGFVSAYANNGEIDVKRGETVKRGQQIAKSGQTGNVSTPQLHFELRKGSTPVDPTQFLAGL